MFSFENDIKSTKWQTMVRLYGRIMWSSRKSIATSLGRSLEILISQGGGSQMPTFLKRERGEGYSNPKTLCVNPHRTCEVSGGDSQRVWGHLLSLPPLWDKKEVGVSNLEHLRIRLWRWGKSKRQKSNLAKRVFYRIPNLHLFNMYSLLLFIYQDSLIQTICLSVCLSVNMSVCLSVYPGFEALNTKWTRGLSGLSGLRPPAPRQQSWGPTCNFHSVILSIISHQYNSTRDRARYNEVNLHSCLKQSRSKYRTTPKVISIRWRSAIGRIVTMILCHGRVR